LRKALKDSPGGKWGAIMLALYGVGLIAAGIFVADPMNGFPPGSPHMNTFTISGMLHLVSGTVGFVGLISACFIFARRFAKQKEKSWRNFSIVTGLLFLFAFIGIAAGSQPGSRVLATVTLDFWIAVILSFTWLSLVFAKVKEHNI
jgi:hypothetical protein